MTIAAGSVVQIAAPFNALYPDRYPVVHVFPDGSAAVAVPGFTQKSATFDPAVDGCNFAAEFLIETGETVDPASIVVSVEEAPPPEPTAETVAIISVSTPSLSGTYRCDARTQQDIASVTLYCQVNNRFPMGAPQLPWRDAAGVPHFFPTIAVWYSFATAIADYVTARTLGQTVPASIQIA